MYCFCLKKQKANSNSSRLVISYVLVRKLDFAYGGGDEVPGSFSRGR